jgi:hypothetical protein
VTTGARDDGGDLLDPAEPAVQRRPGHSEQLGELAQAGARVRDPRERDLAEVLSKTSQPPSSTASSIASTCAPALRAMRARFAASAFASRFASPAQLAPEPTVVEGQEGPRRPERREQVGDHIAGLEHDAASLRVVEGRAGDDLPERRDQQRRVRRGDPGQLEMDGRSGAEIDPPTSSAPRSSAAVSASPSSPDRPGPPKDWPPQGAPRLASRARTVDAGTDTR